MYGVVKSVDRELEIFDGTHEIPKYDIWSASYRLYQSMTFWPAGTIFVSVVDPGVGTPRRACAAKTTEGYYVISPDNGSLTHTKAWQGIVEVREIDPSVNRLKGKNTEGTSVFHGRDLFGYCAARLASGIISYEQVGPVYDINEIVTLPIMEPVLKDGMVQGIFEISDPNFGNLWTNIPLSMFDQAGFVYGDHLKLVIKHQEQVVFNDRVLFHKSFGFAKKGEAIVYNNELMKVSLAVSQGSFSEHYHMDFGPDWVVQFQK